MNEKEQLAWCQREQATVYFTKEGVKVKPHDFSSIKGKTLEEAIHFIEKFRKQREALKALK